MGDWQAQVPVAVAQVSPPLHAAWSTQEPVAPHFCGVVVFLHWRSSGVQTPEHPAVATQALAQVSGAGLLHSPVSQVPAAWYTWPVQLAVPQATVEYAQEGLTPSHLPAQTAWVVTHAACPPVVRGGTSLARTRHVPSEPARSQASHEPVHAWSQQNPSGEQKVPPAQPPPTAWHA